jgi:hypothetical protein
MKKNILSLMFFLISSISMATIDCSSVYASSPTDDGITFTLPSPATVCSLVSYEFLVSTQGITGPFNTPVSLAAVILYGSNGFYANITGLNSCTEYHFQIKLYCDGVLQGACFKGPFTTTGCDSCTCIDNGGFLEVLDIEECKATFGVSGIVTDPNCITPIQHYTWDFGDNHIVTTSSSSIHHTYDSNGLYIVTATIYAINNTTGDTCSRTYTDTVIISDCGASCPSPIDLKCEQTNTAQTLSWSPVLNAVSYEIELIYNDANCCSSGGTVSSTIIPLNSTSFMLSSAKCFSWRVRSICTDSTLSKWSESKCSCGTCNFIFPPTDLRCKQTKNTQSLSWSLVLNAVSYEIELIYNDLKCCSSGGTIRSTIIPLNSNSFMLSSGGCFSWRVRSVCANGTKSVWSEKKCSCYNPGNGTGTGPGFKSIVLPNGNLKGSATLLAVKTIPNPANDFVTITINDPSGKVELNDPKLIIYDINSREVYQSNIALNESTRIDLSTFDIGVYFCKIIDNKQVWSTTKLIVK